MKNAVSEPVDTKSAGAVAAPTSREVEALSLVKSYVGWASGVALFPMPLVDLVAISVTQLRMVKKLGDLYEIPFNENLAKNLIGSLVGTTTPMLAAAPAASLLKMVPIVGSIAGAVTLPLVTGASTYALGKVFIQHFESGGTFLDMDPSSVAAYFKEHFSAQVENKTKTSSTS